MDYTKDYYNTLQISKNATLADIKSAYKRLAKIYHPDTNRNDASAEQKFKQVLEAYEVLSNPEKRVLYDKNFSYKRTLDESELESKSKHPLANAWTKMILVTVGVIVTIIYLFSPFDIIPDFIPILGWLDDIGLLAILISFIRHKW